MSPSSQNSSLRRDCGSRQAAVGITSDADPAVVGTATCNAARPGSGVLLHLSARRIADRVGDEIAAGRQHDGNRLAGIDRRSAADRHQHIGAAVVVCREPALHHLDRRVGFRLGKDRGELRPEAGLHLRQHVAAGDRRSANDQRAPAADPLDDLGQAADRADAEHDASGPIHTTGRVKFVVGHPEHDAAPLDRAGFDHAVRLGAVSERHDLYDSRREHMLLGKPQAASSKQSACRPEHCAPVRQTVSLCFRSVRHWMDQPAASPERLVRPAMNVASDQIDDDILVADTFGKISLIESNDVIRAERAHMVAIGGATGGGDAQSEVAGKLDTCAADGSSGAVDQDLLLSRAVACLDDAAIGGDPALDHGRGFNITEVCRFQRDLAHRNADMFGGAAAVGVKRGEHPRRRRPDDGEPRRRQAGRQAWRQAQRSFLNRNALEFSGT